MIIVIINLMIITLALVSKLYQIRCIILIFKVNVININV